MRDDPRFQHGGAQLERAADALVHLREELPLHVRLRRLLCDPGALVATAGVLTGVPRLAVRTTDAPAGRVVRAYLTARRRGLPINRIAQGVLVLPPTTETYFSGRSRKTMRRHVNRAERRGLVAERFDPMCERHDLLHRWLVLRWGERDWNDRLDEWADQTTLSAQWWIVGGSREPLALAVASIDDEVALVHGLMSRDHDARWLLHAKIVSASIAAGARVLCLSDGDVLRMGATQRLFQRQLGYRVVHLTLRG